MSAGGSAGEARSSTFGKGSAMRGIWVGAIVIVALLTAILTVQTMQTVPARRQAPYVFGVVALAAATAAAAYLILR